MGRALLGDRSRLRLRLHPHRLRLRHPHRARTIDHLIRAILPQPYRGQALGRGLRRLIGGIRFGQPCSPVPDAPLVEAGAVAEDAVVRPHTLQLERVPIPALPEGEAGARSIAALSIVSSPLRSIVIVTQ